MSSKLLGIEEMDSDSPKPVTITDAAVAKIKELAKNKLDAKGKFLRVYVQGGGCSGYTYNFKYDDKRSNDQLTERDGASCIMDPQSITLLKGSVIDYVDGLTGAGFVIKNPNATGTCGCGSSFST